MRIIRLYQKDMEEIKMTIATVKSTYTEHHTGRARRYVSRKSEGVLEPYKGKFGEGYKLFTPAWDSTNYCFVTYYVK